MSQPTLPLEPPAPAPCAGAGRRLRVMQVITHLDLGGAERVAFTLMKGLLGSFDFCLFAVLGVQPGEVGAGMLAETQAVGLRLFSGTRVPVKFGGMLLGGHQLAKAVKAAQPDVLHLHTEIPESVYAAAVALHPKLGKVPLVRTIHNTVYWTPWRRMGRWCERRMPRPFIAAVSPGARDAFLQVRQESGLGPPPVPPRIILNGVSVQPIMPRRVSSASGPIRLLFAGRFEDQKGADLLPAILRRVQSPRPCELTIHGHGTHEPALRQLAASPPAGWTIQLHGPVPNLSSHMPSFDLLLMPSRYEGLSVMAIESLLVGLPVLATRAPGLRDGFPADYPWMATPGDAAAYAALLSRVLAQPQTWPEVAELGARFARENFDVQEMCAAYRQLYQEAVAARRS
jgi:glycosyltransferase involved in cell wall biosynthesis